PLAVFPRVREGRGHRRSLAARPRRHRRHGPRRGTRLARPRPHTGRSRMPGRGRRLAACVAFAAMAIAACGKKGPPVAPEHRAPQPIANLAGAGEEDSITLSWTPPTRRADNTRPRHFTLRRIFRAEDNGAGEPRAAMLVDGRIAGYDEIAAISGAAPAPRGRGGGRRVFPDRQGPS